MAGRARPSVVFGLTLAFGGLGVYAYAQNLTVEGRVSVNNSANGTNYVMGNLGVGTDSPDNKLHVADGSMELENGALRFYPDYAGQGGELDYNNGRLHIGTNSEYATNWHMVIEDGGNVGIGTTAPDELLTLAPGSALKIRDPNNGTRGVYLSNDPITGEGRLSTPARNLTLSTGWNELLSVRGGDAVSIGTYGGNSSVEERLRVDSGGMVVNSNPIYLRNRLSGNHYGIGYAQQGGSQLTVFSDDLIQFTESDGDAVKATWSMNHGRFGFYGEIGIGTSYPGDKLHITDGNIQVSRGGICIDSDGGCSSPGDGTLRVKEIYGTNTSGNDVSLVPSSGNVGIGTSNPGFRLHVVGSAAKTTGSFWTSISDRRLKKNIRAIDGALDTISRLEGRTYEWKDAGSIGAEGGTHIGFIAQEVEAHMPQWVSEDERGNKLINTEGLDALTVEAIKELQTRIERLETQVAACDDE